MTPPVFIHPDLVSVEAGMTVTLDGDEGRHATKSMRLGPGDALTLVDGRGCRIEGAIASVSGTGADVLVTSRMDEPEPRPLFCVVQALPKADRGELAVELLTEIGVDVIVPWAARHCVTQWKGDRVDRGLRKWRDAAQAAGKQSRRARFPVVEGVASTSEVVSRVRQASLALVLHEDATTPIGSLALPPSGEVVIVVGPEGGISPDEREVLSEAGAHEVVLGPSVLRTSSAGMAAAAALLARSDRWSARMTP